jgi:hypothetical protein
MAAIFLNSKKQLCGAPLLGAPQKFSVAHSYLVRHIS